MLLIILHTLVSPPKHHNTPAVKWFHYILANPYLLSEKEEISVLSMPPPPILPARDEHSEIYPGKLDLAAQTSPSSSLPLPSGGGSLPIPNSATLDNVLQSGLPIQTPRTQSPLTFSLDDNLSTISAVRQFEIYQLPVFNESSVLFSNGSGSALLLRKLENLKETEETEDESAEKIFWNQYVHAPYGQFVRQQEVGHLEGFLKNIPKNIRPLVYLKTLQVRYSLKDDFANLVSKARKSNAVKYLPNSLYSGVSAELKDVLNAFAYYIGEVSISAVVAGSGSGNATGNDSYGSAISVLAFIVSIGKLLIQMPELAPQEVFFLLLKFHRLYTNFDVSEFLYKTNRSLEQELETSVLFVHISKQGIDLLKIFKKWISTFFDMVEDKRRLVILDFFVFEGFDYIIRLIVSIIASSSETANGLEGAELNEFLNDATNFSEVGFETALKFSPDLIKYENEYHLLHANSLSNNSNELINLQEANQELLQRINNLRSQLAELSLTHKDILEQSESYKDQLQVATDERKRLDDSREDLKEKYELLSMKENVRNTIKANEDFARRSAELESQIAQIKANIDKKKARIDKMKPVQVAPAT